MVLRLQSTASISPVIQRKTGEAKPFALPAETQTTTTMTEVVVSPQIQNPMKSVKLVGLSASVALLCVIQAQGQATIGSIGVQFQGRDGSSSAATKPGVPALLQSDVAGVVPQSDWNAVDDANDPSLGGPGGGGTVSSLGDSNITTTPVSLEYAANDSWYNDVTPSTLTNANAQLMNGIIKSNGGDGKTESFTFTSVPEGTYDLYVYLTMNGDGVMADVTDNDNLTTYYIKEWHQFLNSDKFVQGTNTNPTGVRDTANYVKFSGLGTFGRGTIGAYVTRRGTAGDGTGVPALQLVPAGPPVVNTNPLALLIQPISRRGADGASNVTFTVSIRGPAFLSQWYQNGSPIAGATGLSYTPSPISASTMQGAQISFKATNNINSVTTSNAILTVGQMITNNGVAVLNGGIVNITTQPQGATVIAHRTGPVSFTVAATSGFIGDASGAAPPIFYQWQSAPKGSSSFTSITGATNATYQTGVPSSADDGTQYRAVVSASDATVNSAVAVLTVNPNTIPPSLLSAAAFPGSQQIGLKFDEALDPATANSAATFKVNGTAVSAAIMRTNVANEKTLEQNLVSLVVPTAISGPFTVTVTGLKDPDGNTLVSTNFTGKVLGLTITDVGSPAGAKGGPDPLVAGVVTNWGEGNYDVLCNGNDYWNNADGMNFIWEPKTNSFDVRVQVVSVAGVNNWSAGAIMAREGPPTPNGGGWELARHYFCKVDYGGPTACLDGSGSGANTYEFNCRLAPGNPALRETGGTQGSNNGATNTAGSSYGWGGSGPGNPSPVPFPNAWIRIARVKTVVNNVTNDHMFGYSSTDGVNWSQREDVNLLDANHAGWLDITGKPAGPMPDVLYVGLASVSHTGIGNGNATNSVGGFAPPNDVAGTPWLEWVVYRNFGDTPQVQGTPTLSVVHNSDGTVSVTYTGNLYSSTTVNGTYTKVASATSPFKVTPVPGTPATFYRAGP